MLYRLTLQLVFISLIGCEPMPDTGPSDPSLRPPASCEILYNDSTHNWHRAILEPNQDDYTLCDELTPLILSRMIDSSQCEVSDYVETGLDPEEQGRFSAIIYECITPGPYGCMIYNCQDVYNAVSNTGYPYPSTCSAGMHRVNNPSCKNMWGPTQ
jgi:hypothetical protein